MSEKYVVKNRSASRVFYKIPELGIRREFMPGETKRIDFDELEKLSFQAGGRELMANFLQIQSQTAIDELSIATEPEYNMSEEQILDLIRNGSLDAFLDCLDFAPTGVIDILKKFAVSAPLTDYEKRKALKDKTGFDVDTAIKNVEAERAETNEAKQAPTRRVKAEEPAAATTTARRTSGTNYKVVNRSE